MAKFPVNLPAGALTMVLGGLAMSTTEMQRDYKFGIGLALSFVVGFSLAYVIRKYLP